MEVGKNEGLGCCGRRATLYITGGSQCPSTSNLNDALHIRARHAPLGKARRAKSPDSLKLASLANPIPPLEETR